jgi:acetyltransferase-like isoleucine patch superfamily enzyme
MEDLKNRFLFFGNNSAIGKDSVIADPSKVYIGNNVRLRTNTCLALHSHGNKEQMLRIKIDDRTYGGIGTIIESYNQVIIEQDCLIGPRVFISDSQHEYSNPYLPIANQGFQSIDNQLVIKRGAWIGANATLIGNITIGYGSVIGANSVVTINVPPHTVVFGNPASILKIYHYKRKEWVKLHSDSEFLEILQERGEFEGYDDRYILEQVRAELDRNKM